MSQPAPGGGADTRVGDAERNAAIDALTQHLSAGRLDLDEFGTRSAQVHAARTVAELKAPFVDLPAPGPVISDPIVVDGPPLWAAPAGGIVAPQPAVVPVPRSRGQQIAVGVAASSGVIAVILFFVLNHVWHEAWLVFLLVPVVYAITGAMTGQDIRAIKRGRR